MENVQPPLLAPPVSRRRHVVTWKLLFIAALVLILQLPLGLINNLRQERAGNREATHSRRVERLPTPADGSLGMAPVPPAYNPARAAAEGYRMVERALKHSMLVLTLVFTAFFLFETLAGLRLHAVHYGLVGAALSLFYLALLALGEVLPPGQAYVGAAVASSLLIVAYCASILRSYARAGLIAALLAAEYGVLYIVLRMEDYALLAGTASLFVVLAALMFFTRHVDWYDQETGKAVQP
jgi:inner membrane protein involved in colicin E2 resistance